MALLIPRRFELKVYDKSLTLRGVLIARNSDASSASFTLEHNGTGTGTVTLPVDHRLVPELMSDGARLQYRYIDHTGASILQMSGFVVADATELSVRTQSVTFTCASDERLLGKILGWPVPGNALSAQTSESDVRTGAVDGVCADFIAANLARLGLPARVVPDVWDGPTATITSRFDPLMEVAKPKLETANRGVRVYQWNPGDPVPFFLTGQLAAPCLLVEIYRCVDRPYVRWSPTMGIASGTASGTAPTATRVIVGGDGEGTARVFEGFVDPTREAAWGALGVQEVFADARNTTDAAGRLQTATEELNEASPRASLETDTADGDPWVVGSHYGLGDIVRIDVGGELRADKVRKITVSVDGANGVRIKPQIGDPGAQTNTHQAVVRSLTDKGRRIRRLESRR